LKGNEQETLLTQAQKENGKLFIEIKNLRPHQ